MSDEATPFRTLVPARLDRLPWSPFHWKVVIALGITWLIDGLEVTLIGSISGVLHDRATLHFTASELGEIGSFYLIGAVTGALVFGHLTDLMGRKKLFFVTLAVYLSGTLLTAFSWNLWSFVVFRLITGAGIGGEYSAVNSAVDELIPARVRGRVDLIVNGSFWLGAAAGAAGTLILLDHRIFPVDIGWRLGFGIGSLLGLIILFYRTSIPESPRWLMTHGREHEAETVVRAIETEIEKETGKPLEPPGEGIVIHPGRSVSLRRVAKAMFVQYRRRSILGLLAHGFPGFPLQRDLLHLPARPHHVLPHTGVEDRPLSSALRDQQFPGAPSSSATSSIPSAGDSSSRPPMPFRRFFCYAPAGFSRPEGFPPWARPFSGRLSSSSRPAPQAPHT